MRLASSRQDYHSKKNMAIASSVERQDTLPRIVQRGRKRTAKKNLNNKGVLKNGDQKPQGKAAEEKKRVKLRPMKTPDLNPDVMSHWIRCDAITWCKIEDDHCLALLDTGATINVITADYARILDLPMGPLSDLREGLQGVKSSQKHLCWSIRLCHCSHQIQ